MSNPGQKRKILLASVLKPVDEPRMFERMGQSLATNGYEVFIAGFPATSGKSVDGVHFLSHKKFSRISVGRILIRVEILKKVFSIRPDIFIVCTHELLGVALLYKIFAGGKIVYDIQENYWMNIVYTNAWPKTVRHLIASLVRFKEIITSTFFSKLFLAEKCYASELKFTKGKSVVIENKCSVPLGFQRKPPSEPIQVIFTGTISESTGVFQTIDLIKKMNEVDPSVRLKILGHCAQNEVLRKLEHELSDLNFVSLVGGKEFVPHEKIMEAIATAHFGVVFYPLSPRTENKIPSKLYEYLACGLPILLQDHKPWVTMCAIYPAAIPLNFHLADVTSILRKMREANFYFKPADEARWQHEEEKLLTAIRQVLA